jgi:hypothetical protein
MTGPEHYKAAEQLLSEAIEADENARVDDVSLLLKFADLHVQLAQCAATIDAARDVLSTSAAEAWLPATRHPQRSRRGGAR